MELGRLIIKIIADTKELREGIKEARTQTEGLRQLGSQLSGAGTKMTAFMTLPILGAGAAAVSAASDLDESMSKSNMVFGESAASIQAWSQTTASSMGISQQAALEAAGTYGNLFQALGVGQEEAARLSPEVVGLAADLASFNNASPEETLLALRAGLTGEAEPLTERSWSVPMSSSEIRRGRSPLHLPRSPGH